jgi:hypothetical protein
MAWTYSNWRSAGTASARLAALRQHMEEVSNAIQSPQSAGSDGHSMSTHDMVAYLSSLERQEERLEGQAEQTGGFIRQRFVPPGC